MHSFHRSRGRIMFEVLCALIVALSLAGAWHQTGAWALLPAGAACLLFAAIGLSDLARADPAVEAVPRPLPSPEEASPAEQPASMAAAPVAATPAPEALTAEPEALTAEPGAMPEGPEADLPAPAPPVRKARAPRKAARPRGKAGIGAGAGAPLPPADRPAAVTPVKDAFDSLLSDFPASSDSARIEPLFDPEPHFRQHRAVFGRKSG